MVKIQQSIPTIWPTSVGTCLLNKKHLSILEVHVAQRKAIRAITGTMYNESASPLFKIAGVLKLSDMLQVSMLQYMAIYVQICE